MQNFRARFTEQDWQKANRFVDSVKEELQSRLPDYQVDLYGFGTNTNQRLFVVNSNPGAPDLSISKNGKIVALVEVQQTDAPLRVLKTFWLNMGKVRYALDSKTKVFFVFCMAKDYHVVQDTTVRDYLFTKRKQDIRGFGQHTIIEIPSFESSPLDYIEVWLALHSQNCEAAN